MTGKENKRAQYDSPTKNGLLEPISRVTASVKQQGGRHRAPNESDRSGRGRGSRGADPTRLDPQDPRMTREYIIIYIYIIYLNKMDNYIIVLR